MTEDEARSWIEDRFGADAAARVAVFLNRVVEESARQNLIAPSTVGQIWARHAVDSAQLVSLAPADGTWIDIGTGGGFPGMIAAILRPCETILVEPRQRRARFLEDSTAGLGVDVRVHATKIEAVEATGSVISARAVASVDTLLLVAQHCAVRDTRWLLPRGRSAAGVPEALQQDWTGVFHVEQSVTDPDSTILVLDGPRRR